MRNYVLILCLLLCLTMPLHAQDNPTPYDIALQRIEEAVRSEMLGLDLSNLGLSEVPPEVWQLTSLQVLYLNDNRLRNLPSEIGQLSNLVELYLNGNGLRNLPPEIGQLSNLRWLYLYANQLTDLPPEIGQLTSLTELYMDHNQLSNLPSEIGQLVNLQVLTLDANQLRSLPSEIGQLVNLKMLSLHSNQIQHLPLEMSRLTSLNCKYACSLNLVNNPLISPPPEVVEQGTAAVLAYLRNQAWYHVQRLIIAGASGVGLLAMLLLGVRHRQSRRKSKVKRG